MADSTRSSSAEASSRRSTGCTPASRRRARVPSRSRILVLHLAGQYPLGGMGWQAVHYVVGLARLGHDVYYVEDSSAPPYDPRVKSPVEDCAYGVEFLRQTMERFGLGDRWAYRDMIR